ncbi:hypothetical protein GCM10011390_41380 [Aureimonas endophytica]|uniref:MlaB-like STAS domain-containing protein n=1 Tax=Aureimonas endophytica TaxID=2027858 RepID=A0A916ZXK5_9HYPH|nr:STAS domain-containing protein [Aureimonas endophytica]GGE17916.1 hypothetical protein GCM10011390_41380 [Aureimonas endophytica]
MPPRKPSTRGTASYDLPAVLDIKAASLLHHELSGLRGKPVSFDASQVQRLGGQCLQVLLAAVAAWKADGKAITVGTSSKGFEEGLALLGFTVETLLAQEA